MHSPTTLPTHAVAFAGLGPLDWVVVLLLTFSGITACMRGLIRSVLSLLGVALGIVLAAWYAPALALWLSHWITEPLLAAIAAFAAVFAFVYLATSLVARVLSRASRAVGLGLFDRLGGAAFGVARGIVVLAALLIPALPFLPLLPFANNSVLLPYLRSAAVGLSFVVPQDFGKRLAAGVQQLSPAINTNSANVPRRTERTAAESMNEGDAP